MAQVTNEREFWDALAAGEQTVTVARSLMLSRPAVLPERTVLEGAAQEDGTNPVLMFQDSDGVGVTASNAVRGLSISAPASRRAVFNAGAAEDLGHFEFADLGLTGQFSFIMRGGSVHADIDIRDVHVRAADTRGYLEQPQKYGVNVLQGALTVYNFNAREDARITLRATGASVGAPGDPVRGSGVFISGFGDEGGTVEIEELTTNEVHATGAIPFGVANIITAGVFIVYGAHAKRIVHKGTTATYGVNDMVLDAWGSVDLWRAEGRVVSYGPSGVGFVNFGTVRTFEALGSVETYGLGARGYNQYDGTLESGTFSSIETFGDGSVGIQVSKQVGSICVQRGITTHGGIGNTLVKGKNVELAAIALSVKDGGSIGALEVGGDLVTHGAQVDALSVEAGGSIGGGSIAGEVVVHGDGARGVNIAPGAQCELAGIAAE